MSDTSEADAGSGKGEKGEENALSGLYTAKLTIDDSSQIVDDGPDVDDEQVARKAKKKKEQEKRDAKAGAKASKGSQSSGAKGGDGDAASSRKANPNDPLPFEHDKHPPLGKPRHIDYCPDCGMPPDFCDWGGKWEVCKPRALTDYPHYYPDAIARGESAADEAAPSAAADAPSAAVKEVAAEKKSKKKEVEHHVFIQKSNRKGRKWITTVRGLDLFGIKLDKMSKIFAKSFSCGASVRPGQPGQPDEVEIQGDVEDQVKDVILKNCPELKKDQISVAR